MSLIFFLFLAVLAVTWYRFLLQKRKASMQIKCKQDFSMVLYNELAPTHPVAQGLKMLHEELKNAPRKILLQHLFGIIRKTIQKQKVVKIDDLLIFNTREGKIGTWCFQTRRHDLSLIKQYEYEICLRGNYQSRQLTIFSSSDCVITIPRPSWINTLFNSQDFEGECLIHLEISQETNFMDLRELRYVGRLNRELAKGMDAMKKHEEWRASHNSGPLLEYFHKDKTGTVGYGETSRSLCDSLL